MSAYLVRNRHQNKWYGRVIIPRSLRNRFNGKREIRKSLGVSDKRQAKFLSTQFWVQCQIGFTKLSMYEHAIPSFANTDGFLRWLATNTEQQGDKDALKYIKFKDRLGNEFEVDYGNDTYAAQKEADFIAKVLEISASLHNELLNHPDRRDDIQRRIWLDDYPEAKNLHIEKKSSVDEAITLYIEKLETQGRKGKMLSDRTLFQYKNKLAFWSEYFDQRMIDTITLSELNDIQNWLTALPANYTKKGLSIGKAITLAKKGGHNYPTISFKTRADYLGQLKAFLEFSEQIELITNRLSDKIEIPSTKQRRDTKKLPFSAEDLQKIFPDNYGDVDFGIHRSGLDFDTKYWFPLLALFTGARLEEIGQLQLTDIKTCPKTKIMYLMIDNQGVADGQKKRVKNANSIRPIPIHSKLIAMGFLDYVEKRKKTNAKNLFELKRDKLGRMAKNLADWFSRHEQRSNGTTVLGYIQRRGVESKGENELGERWSKSFHSFRHTFIDNLRGKKMTNGEFIREEDIALVVGHEKNKKETANYGADRMQLELRRAVVEGINFVLEG